MLKKWNILLILIMLTMTACNKMPLNNEEQYAKGLRIRNLCVGEADAAIIKQGSELAMIDVGLKESADAVLKALSKEGAKEISFIILTHFDKDHVGAVDEVLRKYKVRNIYIPDYEGSGAAYEYLFNCLKDYDSVSVVTKPVELKLGEAKVVIYPAKDRQPLLEAKGEIDNNMSLVTDISYSDRSFVFLGDIEKKRIKQLIEEDYINECDWIKYPYHGRYKKAHKKLLEKLKPRYAVISTSLEEGIASDTNNLLSELNIQSLDTMRQDVVTECDENGIRCE